jgi:hypothetical protein
VESDEEPHALLERAAKLMVKAGFMESSFYLDMVTRRNPPKK